MIINPCAISPSRVAGVCNRRVSALQGMYTVRMESYAALKLRDLCSVSNMRTIFNHAFWLVHVYFEPFHAAHSLIITLPTRQKSRTYAK